MVTTHAATPAGGPELPQDAAYAIALAQFHATADHESLFLHPSKRRNRLRLYENWVRRSDPVIGPTHTATGDRTCRIAPLGRRLPRNALNTSRLGSGTGVSRMALTRCLLR